MNTQAATILVLDHDKNTRDSLVKSLSERGHEVIIANDGQTALQILGGRSIDLVLLDTQMPVLSGLDILRALRNNAATEALPVIMLSASAESEDTLQAFEFGASDVVNRPLDTPVLMARVQAQLRRKKPLNRPHASQSTTSNPGIVIAGQYRVEERIGEGGFGAVFRASRMSDNLLVAVKVLQTTLMPSQKALTRFQIEGITTRRVQHPNAVMVFDSGVTLDGLAFMVMELLSGIPLDKQIKLGPVSTKRAAEIMIPVCDAVDSAHRVKIIHRDIKPSNIFLHQSKGAEVPKVLDFGLAKIVDESFGENFTREGHVLGTVSYVAPERLRSQPYDGRSDIYSLGATLYELVAGFPPFTTPTPDPAAVAVMHLRNTPAPLRERRPEISAEFDALVLSMLEKEPSLRPSIPEIIKRLRPVAAGPDVAPSVLTPSEDAEPKFGTMVLTEVFEGSNPIQAKPAPVDPIAKTHPYVAPQVSPSAIKKGPPPPPPQEEKVFELGESSIMQSFDAYAPLPTMPPPLAAKPPANLVKAPTMPAAAPKPLLASPAAPKAAPIAPKATPSTPPKPSQPTGFKPPSYTPPKPLNKPIGALPPPKPMMAPPPPLAPPKPLPKPTAPTKAETKKE